LDAPSKDLLRQRIDSHLPAGHAGGPFVRLENPDCFDVTMVRKDRTSFASEVQCDYVPAHHDYPFRIRFVFRDVTERKKPEDALRRTEAQLRSFAANAPVVLFSADADGLLTLLEGKGLDALGLRPGELVGQPYFALAAGNSAFQGLIAAALGKE